MAKTVAARARAVKTKEACMSAGGYRVRVGGSEIESWCWARVESG